LRDTKTLRVPNVLAVSDTDGRATGEPSYLMLEYIQPRPARSRSDFTKAFASQLAGLHRTTTNFHGLDRNNFIGDLPQLNDRNTSWAEFSRDCRVIPQLEIARDRGRLPAQRERAVMRACEKIEGLLYGTTGPPSLLHGDLWSGNYIEAGDEPVVI